MTALISTERVTRRFGSLTAVDEVTLEVTPGEVVGLLGANGAGKSTLIRMILGLLPPSSGSVELFGAAPGRSGRARLGYVPQGLGLYPDLTVEENLAFVTSAFSVEMPPLDPELDRIRRRTVGGISLGHRRRVAFAAALSHHPELLVLDEPTSGVGPLGRTELWATIGEAASSGVGVLVSTHYMEEAEQCDRLLMMAAGRVVAEGTAADMTAAVSTVEVVTDAWQPVLEVLEDAGLHPSLSGTSVRLTDVPADRVRAILASGGLEVEVRPVAAGFEEAFVALSTR